MMTKNNTPTLTSAAVLRITADIETGSMFVGEGCEEHIASLLSAADKHPKIELASGIDGDDEYWDEDLEFIRPYRVSNGILKIPVHGMLVSGLSFAFFGYFTGYDYIERAIMRGLEDPEVRGIALDINSPGGYVTGCFELGDFIYEARNEKPIHAFAYHMAASAAYVLAAATESISLSTTAHVGSIGVVMRHVEYSKMNERIGRKVTFITFGADKAAGNSDQPLDEGIRKHWQEEVDTLGKMFVSNITRYRGMSEEDILATRARTFMGQKAIDIGLADYEGLLNKTLMIFDDNSDERSNDMTDKTVAAKAVTQEEHTAAVTAARAEGHAAGIKEGAAQARERHNAIMASDEAKQRPLAAANVALNSDMATDKALAFLAGMPIEASAPAGAAPAAGAEAPLATDPKTNQQFTAAVEGGDTQVPAAPAPTAKTDAEVEADEVASLLAMTGRAKKREVPA